MFDDDGDRTKLLSQSLKLIAGAGAGVAIGVLSTLVASGVDSGEYWWVVREATDCLCCESTFFGDISGVSSMILDGAVVAVVSVWNVVVVVADDAVVWASEAVDPFLECAKSTSRPGILMIAGTRL